MSKPKVRIVSKKGKPFALKDGTYSLKLRVYFQGVNRDISIDVRSVTWEEYEKLKSGVVRGSLSSLKSELNKIVARAESIIEEMDRFDWKEFKIMWEGGFAGYEKVKWWFDLKVRENKERGSFRNANITETAWVSLVRFMGRDDFVFSDITPKVLGEYEAWFLREGSFRRKKGEGVVARPGSISTASMYLRTLRSVFNMAKQEGKLKDTDIPFGPRRYTIPRAVGNKRALKEEEVAKLFEYKPPFQTRIEWARDMFLFMYLAQGMNPADLVRLKFKNIQGDYLYYTRKKTAGTRVQQRQIRVHIKPYLRALLNKYASSFPAPDSFVFLWVQKYKIEDEKNMVRVINLATRGLNKYLKIIAGEIGITKDITCYWARHSYASMMNKYGMPIQELSERMGHTTPDITRHYLSTMEDQEQKLREIEEKLIPKRKIC